MIALLVLLGGIVAFDVLLPHKSVELGLGMERSRSGLHEARATVGRFDIAYLEGGEGPPLLLLHGFGADKDNFTRVARHLTPKHRVIIPDLPGYGDSSKPEDAGYTIADQVEYLRQFVKQLNLGKVHLGGNSMGGYIASAWAARYPDEVESLWLLAPAATRVAMNTSELAAIYKETGRNPLLARAADEHAFVRGFVMSKPPLMPYSFKKVLGERAAANFALHEKIFKSLATGQALEEWHRAPILTPALIVWGRKDRALHPDGAAATAALMPRAKVVLMEGIGHLPMVEDVAGSARDYLAFRDSL